MAIMPLKQDKCLSQVELLGMITSRIPCRMSCSTMGNFMCVELGGRRYLTGPVILVRADMDGNIISLTIDEVYIFQKYLESHSVTLMVGGQKMPCICME